MQTMSKMLNEYPSTRKFITIPDAPLTDNEQDEEDGYTVDNTLSATKLLEEDLDVAKPFTKSELYEIKFYRKLNLATFAYIIMTIYVILATKNDIENTNIDNIYFLECKADIHTGFTGYNKSNHLGSCIVQTEFNPYLNKSANDPKYNNFYEYFYITTPSASLNAYIENAPFNMIISFAFLVLSIPTLPSIFGFNLDTKERVQQLRSYTISNIKTLALHSVILSNFYFNLSNLSSSNVPYINYLESNTLICDNVDITSKFFESQDYFKDIKLYKNGMNKSNCLKQFNPLHPWILWNINIASLITLFMLALSIVAMTLPRRNEPKKK